MKECRELPSHDLLLEIFENNSRETFGKNVFQLFDCVDFVQLDISLENLLTKPNCLDCAILALRSKLQRQSLSQHQCSWIVFMDGDVHGCISNRKIGGLSQQTNHVNDGILASIVDRDVSVCNFDCQNTGHSAKVMMNPVRLLAQAGSVWSSWPYIPAKSASGYASISQTLLEGSMTIQWSEVCLR
jgi:hypothetical protein